jgi:hypothetical protein
MGWSRPQNKAGWRVYSAVHLLRSGDSSRCSAQGTWKISYCGTEGDQVLLPSRRYWASGIAGRNRACRNRRFKRLL